MIFTKIPFLLKRVWQSSVITTWSSYLARSLSLLVVLPLILKKFEAPEIALWYLFSSIISFQSIIDMGFSPTFARVIGYGMGGANEIEDIHSKNNSDKPSSSSPNWIFIERVCSTMNVIYFRLSLLFLVFLLVATLLLIKPIAEMSDQSIGWMSWIFIIFSSTITFKNVSYMSYLHGTNHIAIQRRSETFILILSIASSFVVLLLDGNLLLLVISSQIWNVIYTFWLKYLCNHSNSGVYQSFKTSGIDKKIFSPIWDSAWKSGLGVFFSFGVVQLTGMFYAQIGNPRDVAAYLFSLKIAQTISYFSQAPFYTKLPLLAKLRYSKKVDEILSVSQKGFFISYLFFVVSFIFVGLFINPALEYIHSKISFVSTGVWLALGWAYFCERYGAMHLQLFSISNKIIWHIANGVTGTLNIILIIIMYNHFGILAFPLSMFSSYLLFYSWYSAMHSYGEFKMKFIKFESKTIFLPLALLIGYSIYILGGS